jgi:hypothetical protein
MNRDRERRIRAAVPCPRCGAAIGEPCHASGDTRATRRRVHHERYSAWREAALRRKP